MAAPEPSMVTVNGMAIKVTKKMTKQEPTALVVGLRKEQNRNRRL
jgi:hypothetical protein